jgi:hypothetical protein
MNVLRPIEGDVRARRYGRVVVPGSQQHRRRRQIGEQAAEELWSIHGVATVLEEVPSHTESIDASFSCQRRGAP